MEDNTALIAASNGFFTTLTLIGFIVGVIWILDLILLKFGFFKSKRSAYEMLAKYALPLGFLVSLFAMIGSLYYQYYLHIPPCELCWYQRIFAYPLVVMFGMAWWKTDGRIHDYVMGISAIGFVIALYHHYLQLGYDLYAPCSTALFAVECSTPTFIEYGFITYPFMALVTFGFTFLLSYTAKRFSKAS